MPAGQQAPRVELLFFDGCPNHEALLVHLRALVADAGGGGEVELVRVDSAEQAQAQRFLGSPTVRVGGLDVEPGADERSDFGLNCRLYRTGGRLSGVPADEWILAALAARS